MFVRVEYLSKEHWWSDADRGKPKYLGRLLSLCQFVYHKSHPRGLTWASIRTSAVREWRLTAWAMACTREEDISSYIIKVQFVVGYGHRAEHFSESSRHNFSPELTFPKTCSWTVWCLSKNYIFKNVKPVQFPASSNSHTSIHFSNCHGSSTFLNWCKRSIRYQTRAEYKREWTSGTNCGFVLHVHNPSWQMPLSITHKSVKFSGTLGCFGNMCTGMYSVLYCLYCVFLYCSVYAYLWLFVLSVLV